MADIGTVLPSLKDEEILKVFHEFDTDHSGDISLDEFETGIKKLKLPLSHRDIVDLLSIADTNKDGKISFQNSNNLYPNKIKKSNKHLSPSTSIKTVFYPLTNYEWHYDRNLILEFPMKK
eukprot:640367_1